MPKTTFVATDPFGVVHTRTSQNRTYTHTVVARPDYDTALRSAILHASASATAVWRTSIPFLNITTRAEAEKIDPYYRRNFDDAWAQQCIERTRDYAQGLVDAYGNLEAYVAAMKADAEAEVNKRRDGGYYTSFHNMGWCGRADLADKLHSSVVNGKYGRWAEVHTLVATVKGA